jgi:hypothetical protein
VVPDLLHVVPVGDDTVLDRVLQGQDSSLRLGLVTDVRVLLTHADHDTLVSGSSDDGTARVATSAAESRSEQSKVSYPVTLTLTHASTRRSDSREDGSRSIITGETGLAHTGTVVDNEGGDCGITRQRGEGEVKVSWTVPYRIH